MFMNLENRKVIVRREFIKACISMSILRKRGKERIRFRIMNNRVTNRDFKYLKRLFIKCLIENQDIAEQLNENYKLIQVYFFYESTDPNVEDSLRNILDDSAISHSKEPIPSFAQSRKNVGCIMVFLKHLNEFTQKREDITDIERYHKSGIFEELCHLVEQKGDSSIHPSSYGTLWRLYFGRNLLHYGNEIIARLDTDRNHFEVYSMMIKAYPNEWTERYWRYFMEVTPDTYKQKYEQWKPNTPINIVYARLITDTLRSMNVLYVAEKVPREKLSDKNKELLDILIETGKLDIEKKKSLIEKDMGFAALSLIDSIDESIFKTPDVFFSIVLDLWKTLHLWQNKRTN